MTSVTSVNKPAVAWVLDVSKVPTGTHLSSAHSAGALTLNVDSVSDFDPRGGQLQIDGTTYTYSSIDETTNQIFLPAGITFAAEDNEPVRVFPLSEEKWALVQADPEEDGVRAKVPHNLSDKFPLGIRGDTDRETVTIALERSEWTIQNIVALPPNVYESGMLRTSALETGSRWRLSGGPDVIGELLGWHAYAEEPFSITLEDDPRLLPSVRMFAPAWPLEERAYLMLAAGFAGSNQGSRVELQAQEMDVSAIGFEAARISPNQTINAATVTAVQWAAPSIEKGLHRWARVGTSGANAALWVCPQTAIYAVTTVIGWGSTPTTRGFVDLWNGPNRRIRFPCTGEVVGGANQTCHINEGEEVKVEVYSAVANSITGGYIGIYKVGV